MTLKLLSYNIRFGGRGRESRIAEVVRSVAPDLVVFQEATDTRVIERVSAEAGMPVWGARPAHSLGFISRTEITRHEWHYPRAARHSFLEIELPTGARVFGLHLSARFSKWSESRRLREVNALLEGIKAHEHGFHVLTGDFNTLAPGETLNVAQMPTWIKALVWISGRDIKRETVRRLLDAGYADGYRALHPEVKGYTFPVWNPHARLDYVFIPTRHAARLTRCEVVADAPDVTRASDHFPLLAHIEMPG